MYYGSFWGTIAVCQLTSWPSVIYDIDQRSSLEQTTNAEHSNDPGSLFFASLNTMSACSLPVQHMRQYVGCGLSFHSKYNFIQIPH